MGYYFDIKPSKKESNSLAQIISVIRDYWDKNRKDKETLSKTYANKILYDLIENEKSLKFITRGWYKYGAIINSIPASYIAFNLGQDIENHILGLCKEYDCNKNRYDWQSKQYEKFNDKLYSSMLNLKISLEESKPQKDRIMKCLSEFYISLYDIETYDKVNSLLGEFISLSEQVILSSQNLQTDSKKVLQFFNEVWDCFANFNYYKTVKGEKKDEAKERALNRYKLGFVNCKTELTDYFKEEIQSSKRVVLKATTPVQVEIYSEMQKANNSSSCSFSFVWTS